MRYRTSFASASQCRRGMVLLVVMAMLALFSATALAFVFYADAEAVAANSLRQALVKDQADIDAELLMGYFLNQLIYDTDNVNSALRGWSLARSIYGYNPGVLNFTPYNGVGRESFAPSTVPDPDLGIPVFNMINAQTYWNPSAPLADRTVNFARTPEYYGKNFFGPGATPPSPSYLGAGGTYRYVGGANPPWTAYDTNSLFLAQVQADGTVLMPSFTRPWLTSAANGSPAAVRKYMSLSPDPTWNPQMVLPDADAGGHVRSRDAGPGNVSGGNNDSIWMDLGFPVMTAPNGKRYKPLFAPHVVDLSNRLHLWAHGNRVVAGSSSVSNEGFGPPEVNPVSQPGNLLRQNLLTPADYQLLKNLIYGGASGTPASLAAGPPPTGFRPTSTYPFYGWIDSNGFDSGSNSSTSPYFAGFSTAGTVAGANSMTVPSTSGTTAGGFPWTMQIGMILCIDFGPNQETVQVASVTPTSFTTTAAFTKPHKGAVSVVTLFPFPTYPTTPASLPGSSGWNNANAKEMTNNPLSYNIFNPAFPNIAPLPMSHMEALLRFGGTNSPALTSDPFRRLTGSFGNVRTRNMFTLANWHLDRIAASPYIPYPPTAGGKYLYTAGPAPQQVPGAVPSPPTYIAPANGDYTAGWRSNLGQMLRVNLNRTLAEYPTPTLPNAAGIIDLSKPPIAAQYTAAVTDRTNFARDIYNALIRVTGAQDPNKVASSSVADYQAARWLAQLAVNIVDFIDDDDISTAFNWNTTAPASVDSWVFGTELPRLVLNEVYASYDNNNIPGDIDPILMTSLTAKLNLYAELHNPFKPTPPGYAYPNDGGSALLTVAAGTVLAQPSYKIVAYQSNPLLTASLRDPANPKYNLGHPGSTDLATAAAIAALRLNAAGADVGDAVTGGWGPNAFVQPANGRAGSIGAPPGALPGGDFTTAAITAAGASEVLTTVTITTTAAHGFVPGQTVVINGVGNAGYNGSFTIVTVPSGTTFTYFNPTPALPPSGSGSATAGGNNSPTRNNGYFVVGPAGAKFWPTRDLYLPTNYSSSAMSIGKLATDPVIPGVTLLLQRLAIPHLPWNPAPGLTYNPYITVDYVDGVKVNDNRAFGATPAITLGLTPAFGSSYGRKQPYSAYNNPLVPLASQVVSQVGSGVVGQPANTFFGVNNPTDAPFTWLTHLDRALVNQLELRQVSGYKPHELTQQFITYNAGGAKLMFQHRAPWKQQNALIYRALDVLGTPSYMAGTVRGGRLPGNINLNTITEAEIFQALCDAQDGQTNRLFSSGDVDTIFNKLIQSRNITPGLLPTSDGKPFKPLSAGNVQDTWLRADPTNPAAPLFRVGVGTDHPYRKHALLNKIFNTITTTSNVFAVWCTVGYFEVVDETVTPARLGAEIGRGENRHLRHRFFAIVDRSGLQLFNTKTGSAVAAGTNSVGFTPPAGSTVGGVPFAIQPGMLLEIDSGANAEVVAVTGVFPGNIFIANFTLPHAAGATIICRGNPGPQTNNYNPRKDTNVVLHMSVIQ